MHADQFPILIFLHGWGQSAQIWHQQIKYFSAHYSTYTIHLPGHGGAPNISQAHWAQHITDEINHVSQGSPVLLMAWSLGGQIALHIQQHIHNLTGLVLVSTTPCFRQQEDWQYGCNDEVWQGFSQAATTQNPKLMQRFFQMMLHGDKLTRKDMQTIAKEAINKQQPPTQQSLQAGLSLLSNLDLRKILAHIAVPSLIVHGVQDVIVPQEAGQYLSHAIPHATLQVFEECGHAPFLTHHAAFNQQLEAWWKNLSM
ncbi:MAG: alpha/beta fold hydrolase [Ghiorsea sp.]|nr:alpha/beta fold hydrolase [Ghiorsea sp.]